VISDVQKSKEQFIDAICNDKILAWMQITNYKVYLKGCASKFGPSKEGLKLRATRQSRDSRKITELLFKHII